MSHFPRSSEKQPSSSKKCPRCSGLLVPEDVREHQQSSKVLRCVNCGHYQFLLDERTLNAQAFYDPLWGARVPGSGTRKREKRGKYRD